MKKILVVLLTALLCLSVSACGSKEGGNSGSTITPSQTATPEPELTEEEKWALEVKKYAGEFVAVDMINVDEEEQQDYASFLADAFADKSYYMYSTVTEDGHFDMFIVTDGEEDDLYEGQSIIFDPIKGTIYLEDNPLDKIDLEVVDYDNFTVSFDGSSLVFKRTTEIPHNN